MQKVLRGVVGNGVSWGELRFVENPQKRSVEEVLEEVRRGGGSRRRKRKLGGRRRRWRRS